MLVIRLSRCISLLLEEDGRLTSPRLKDLLYRPSYIMNASKPRRGQIRRDRSDLFGDSPPLSRASIKIPTIRSANCSGYEDL